VRDRKMMLNRALMLYKHQLNYLANGEKKLFDFSIQVFKIVSQP